MATLVPMVIPGNNHSRIKARLKPDRMVANGSQPLVLMAIGTTIGTTDLIAIGANGTSIAANGLD